MIANILVCFIFFITSCDWQKVKEGRITNSASEIDIALHFFDNAPVIIRSFPWRRSTGNGGRINFERSVSVGGPEPESIMITGQVILDNANAQRKRYMELEDAIANGRILRGAELRKFGVISLNQGRNVSEVRFIGSRDQYLECEIIGFHMPTYLARCGWIVGDVSFSLETDPRLIGYILTKKDSLFQAWKDSLTRDSDVR